MQIHRYLFGTLINLDLICFVLVFISAVNYACKSGGKGHKFLIFNLVIFFIVHLSSFSRVMLYQLEHRFPEQTELPQDAKGLILLGGSFSLLDSQFDRRPVYNLAGGRLIEFVALARRYPHLPIVFTGAPIEVELTKKIFNEVGIDLQRVAWESKSRNTADNAGNSHSLVRPAPEDKWVLVTSAFHMPRSMGLFRGAGWNVTAYPVDYHVTSFSFSKLMLSILDRNNPVAWKVMTTEWVGLFNNYMSGKSSEFFPK